MLSKNNKNGLQKGVLFCKPFFDCLHLLYRILFFKIKMIFIKFSNFLFFTKKYTFWKGGCHAFPEHQIR